MVVKAFYLGLRVWFCEYVKRSSAILDEPAGGRGAEGDDIYRATPDMRRLSMTAYDGNNETVTH